MSRLWAALRAVALLLGITMIVVTVTPVVDGLGALLAGRWDEARGDTLIVLTGSSLENGVIGESSYWRSVYAVLFWRKCNTGPSGLRVMAMAPEPRRN
jgi:uncharacterized SAM-binding protein YcdF (DUF218 family)